MELKPQAYENSKKERERIKFKCEIEANEDKAGGARKARRRS
jgi:hypothetical protein